MIRRFLTLAGVLSFAVVGAHAQQPEVAFIGDTLTAQWQASPQFQANKNWLPYGFSPVLAPGCCKGTWPALAELKQIIAKGQKPIIHLMVEQADAEGEDAGGNQQASILAAYAHDFEQIIQTAQAAKLKIIVGLEPFSLFYGNVTQLDNWTKLYCLAHNIPVVDYASAIIDDPGRYRVAVNEWARSTWQAYRALHPIARQWLGMSTSLPKSRR